MYKLTFILSVSLFLFSCSDDDFIETRDPNPVIEEPINESLIDSFLWTVPIDSSTIRNRTHNIARHALLHGDLVIFHTPSLAGWVALDAKTGETVWDNRGQLNRSEIVDTPIQHGDNLYYMRTSSFLKLNMNTGILELKELWPVKTEFQNNYSTLDDGIIYNTIDPFNNAVPDFVEWVRISVDEIATPPLNWTRFNRYVAADNEEVFRGSGQPNFFTDANAHKNMIYPSNNRTADLINTVNNTVTSFDLDADTIKWHKKVSNFGAFSTPSLIEEDRLYYLVDSSMICLSSETGDQLWKADSKYFDETFAFGAGMHIVGNKIVAIGRNQKNVGVDKFTGEVKWFVDYDANHPDRLAKGSQQFSTDLYQGRIYYISGWGQLVSLNPESGSVRRYYLPDRPYIEEYDIQLFEPWFKFNGMTISDDGIIYLSEGLRFLALEVPDKDL